MELRFLILLVLLGLLQQPVAAQALTLAADFFRPALTNSYFAW